MLTIFQIDAFTNRPFGGNPAAVIPLREWLTDQTMQAIAAENNLSETAFFVPIDEPDHYHIRWFTPTTEVNLCGHATLATAYAVFFCLKTAQSDRLEFKSRSGRLSVERQNEWLQLDFPADRLEAVELPDVAKTAFQKPPLEVLRGKEDYLLIYDSEQDIRDLKPDFRALGTIPARGFIAGAPGNRCDFVSRCFYPAFGIDEDPVTGSAHTTLVPYWAARLAKTTLEAEQISARGGQLRCTLAGERVLMAGQGRLYLEGKIRID